MKNTLVVNLVGGQGSGKSTMMAHLFAQLKWNNIDCEMCSEFAKELVWENRQETFKDELYIFAKQNHRLFRCNGKVDVIITDRPLIMSIAYNRYYGDQTDYFWNAAYESIVYETFNKQKNLNIFLNRVKPFNPNGRNENEEDAKKFDEYFKASLEDLRLPYHEFDGDSNSVEEIGEMIIGLIKRGETNDSEH